MLSGTHQFLERIQNLAKQNVFLQFDVQLEHRFTPGAADFEKIRSTSERFILYREANGINLDDYTDFDFTSSLTENDENFKILVNYYRFLQQQKPFIEHMKKLLPETDDNRWNSCFMTLADILVWEEKRDVAYYDVFQLSVGLLSDFFRNTSISSTRFSPTGLVALLEMDKALVNAYFFAKHYYLKNGERAILGERSRDDLLSIEFRKDLIDFIENWQNFVNTFRSTLLRAAGVDTVKAAYIEARIKPIELKPGAVEILYGDSGRIFTPLRQTEIAISDSSFLIPAYSLSKQMKKMSLRPSLKKSTSYPNFKDGLPNLELISHANIALPSAEIQCELEFTPIRYSPFRG